MDLYESLVAEARRMRRSLNAEVLCALEAWLAPETLLKEAPVFTVGAPSTTIQPVQPVLLFCRKKGCDRTARVDGFCVEHAPKAAA